MTDLSTAPESEMDSRADHDVADANDVGGSGALTELTDVPDLTDSATATVPAVLAFLEEAGWRTLSGQAASGKQAIDYIAIGPGGIFVIDDHLLDAAGAAAHSSGVTVPESIIAAANQLADAARQVLPPLTRQYVVAVLTFVANAPMSTSRGPVQVCTTSTLRQVITSRPPALSGREIDEVLAIMTAALDTLTPTPSAPTPEPEREPRRATPKRLKLGWRGGHEDEQPPAAEAAPTDTTLWPAVTPPPVWEPPAPNADSADSELEDVEPDGPTVEIDDEERALFGWDAEVESSADADEGAAEVADEVADDVADELVAEHEEPVANEPAPAGDVEPTIGADSADDLDADVVMAASVEAEIVPDDIERDIQPEEADEAEAEAQLATDFDEDAPALIDAAADADADAVADRDPLVGSFPIGWRNADSVDLPAESVSPFSSSATSPWATIRLPEPDSDLDVELATETSTELSTEFPLELPAEPIELSAELATDLPTDVSTAPAAGIETALPTEPTESTEPTAAPTPIGRTQPGGRRRAPSAPWHSKLMPRSKPARTEGGRRAAPSRDATPDESEAPATGPTVIEGVSTPAARSRRAAKARPRTLSARNGVLTRETADAEPRPRVKRGKADKDAAQVGGSGESPASLSSRGQKMYAAMSARQASAADEVDDEPTKVGAPIRRLVVGGIAAGILIASATHVTSISTWVADHVPGIGHSDSEHNPKGGGDEPGRSANLDAPNGSDSHGGDKNTKP